MRAALHVAAALYQGAGTDTAFGLFAACHAEQTRTCGARDLNSLVAGYGPALIDRAAHPDLYHRSDGVVRLKITAGRIALGSLHCPGFAVAAEPHWAGMRPMPET